VNEFELIARFFAREPVRRADVTLGIGDDCALLAPRAGVELAVTTDLLVAGVHFFADVDPAALGHKALAVNLSDLAAMGAEPTWFTLNLALPAGDVAWLEKFSAGLFALARRYDIALVGGDTVRGPLAVGIQACGYVPPGQALRRRGAAAGDRVFVTGELGDAGLALQQRRGQLSLPAADAATVGMRLDWPAPRVAAGVRLRGIASAAIDLSDGLAADLGHILEASGVGAVVARERVPLSAVYRRHLARVGWDLALANGDDYELCFTVPAGRLAQLEAVRAELDCPVTEIGEVVGGRGLRIEDADGREHRLAHTGHDHFA
jgi:thiamine-monophosphate kinase